MGRWISQTIRFWLPRSGEENAEAAFAGYLRALYAERPLDLIVSFGAPAVAFVQRYRQQLFATTPMVFTAVEQRRVQYSILTENDTVVAVAAFLPSSRIFARIAGYNNRGSGEWQFSQ